MAEKTALARLGPRVAIGYVVALFAVIAALIVQPFSQVLMGLLFVLVGLFFAFAVVVLGYFCWFAHIGRPLAFLASLVGLAGLIATAKNSSALPHSNAAMVVAFSLFGGFLAFVMATVVFMYVRLFGMLARPSLTYLRVRAQCLRTNRFSRASDPGRVPLSKAKLARFHPELFARGRNPFVWLDRFIGLRAAVVYSIRDHLIHGDSRAAVVVSVEPLVVAAYNDELDCVALLRFPGEVAKELDLQPRTRLLTVNRFRAGEEIAPDLAPGPLSYNRCSNVIPLIADFLTDDADRLRDRKREIRNDEWTRAWVLGQAALTAPGAIPRDGRPLLCGKPGLQEEAGT